MRAVAGPCVAVQQLINDANTPGRRNYWSTDFMKGLPDEAVDIAQIREMAGALKPWATGRLYLNMMGEEGPGRVAAGFGPEKYARLQELKRIWDPENVFRHNQNITPAP